MKRFVIRNYGPSRQIPCLGETYCLINDSCIETDDTEVAAVFQEEDRITVTDRGSELAPISVVSEEIKEEKVTLDPNDLSYDDLSLSELRILAKDRGMKGIGGCKIGELIEALEAYDEAEVAEVSTTA